MSCADRLTSLSATNEGVAVPGTLPGTVVLLATYNGVEFLADQLNSLRQQDDPDWVLVIRDDLSTDGTPALLDAFAATCLPGQVLRIAEGPVRLGALGNFLALLKAAPAAQRYAFCDQDDVWLPDKLTRAARLMDCETQERPVLYCARQRIVDDALNERGLSPPLARPPSLRNAIVQNIAIGCTIVMNEAARLAILATPAPTVTFHDWWSYLVTTAVGGHVVVDPEPVIMYRQHAANVVGAAPGITGRALRATRRGPDHFMTLFMAHANGLLLHPGLTPDSRRLLLELLALPQAGRLARIVMLRRSGLYRQGMLEQLALYAWVTLWHPSEEERAVHG